MLANPLTERGMAVLTPDMPGTGAALFDHDLKCRGLMLESAFDAAFSYLENRDDIDSDKIGHFGLCMGGGYAFRAASKRPESKCCVSLFPLFINIADSPVTKPLHAAYCFARHITTSAVSTAF